MAMRLIGFIDDLPLLERVEDVLSRLEDSPRSEYVESLRQRVSRHRRAMDRLDVRAAAEALEDSSQSRSDPELATARRFARAAEAARLARIARDHPAALRFAREAEHARASGARDRPRPPPAGRALSDGNRTR
jgi:hypothetical protein